MTLGRNRYTCAKCRGHIITEDRDEGTTPFMIDCKATPGCDGVMQSSCYFGDFVNSAEPATFIWRRPTPKELIKANRIMREHFSKGGLDIYPVLKEPK